MTFVRADFFSTPFDPCRARRLVPDSYLPANASRRLRRGPETAQQQQPCDKSRNVTDRHVKIDKYRFVLVKIRELLLETATPQSYPSRSREAT